MKKLTCLLAQLAMLAAALAGQAADKKILVYTRNYVSSGKGYVHDNIQSSVEAIKKMGVENGFAVDVSDDPKVFSDDNLKQYKALVFSNSNNEAFENDAQREAFTRYIKSGGGFVGIHSATGSERNWPYYWYVAGGKFLRHPKLQSFVVKVKDPNHPATKDLPATFEWTDECYYHENMAADLHVLLATDPAKLEDPKKAEYPGDRFGDSLPLAWYHNVEAGRAFYTALGHKKEDYANPILVKHILGGILWAMGEAK
jgi:type 1 glutamine amidotransferase